MTPVTRTSPITCNSSTPLGKAKNYTTKGGVWVKRTLKQQPSKQAKQQREKKALLLALDQLMDCVTPCPWRDTFTWALCLPTVLEQTWELRSTAFFSYWLRSIANRSVSYFFCNSPYWHCSWRICHQQFRICFPVASISRTICESGILEVPAELSQAESVQWALIRT